jgi:hypothetical protein
MTPNDGALTSGVDITAPPADKVHGDQTRVLGTIDIVGRTHGLADLLSEGPSRALPFGRSSSPSTGTEAALDA